MMMSQMLLILFLMLLVKLLLLLLMPLRVGRVKPLGECAKQRASAAVADRIRRQIEATQRRQTDGKGARECGDVC